MNRFPQTGQRAARRRFSIVAGSLARTSARYRSSSFIHVTAAADMREPPFDMLGVRRTDSGSVGPQTVQRSVDGENGRAEHPGFAVGEPHLIGGRHGRSPHSMQTPPTRRPIGWRHFSSPTDRFAFGGPSSLCSQALMIHDVRVVPLLSAAASIRPRSSVEILICIGFVGIPRL